MDKISKDQMGANSVLIILLILKREDSYGYSITQELKTISSGRINWKEGSLYPVLKKMEANEFVKSYWNLEESDRPRKYYKILEKGETEIERLFEERDLMISIIDNLKSRV
jgi:DNA-binding PadR family transcriptional regulator